MCAFCCKEVPLFRQDIVNSCKITGLTGDPGSNVTRGREGLMKQAEDTRGGPGGGRLTGRRWKGGAEGGESQEGALGRSMINDAHAIAKIVSTMGMAGGNDSGVGAHCTVEGLR